MIFYFPERKVPTEKGGCSDRVYLPSLTGSTTNHSIHAHNAEIRALLLIAGTIDKFWTTPLPPSLRDILLWMVPERSCVADLIARNRCKKSSQARYRFVQVFLSRKKYLVCLNP